MRYLVTHREVLITSYLVTDADDEDEAADCVRSGLANVETLYKDTESMPDGEDDWEFKVVTPE